MTDNVDTISINTVSAFCLVGLIYSSLIMEALFSSPGAFVRSEIEVSSHCICITGSLRQNIIPSFTQTPHRCCFIVLLLDELSPVERALFPFSLALSYFKPQDNKGNLVDCLTLYFWNIFFSFCFTNLTKVLHRGKITADKRVITGQTAKCLFSMSLVGCKDESLFLL